MTNVIVAACSDKPMKNYSAVSLSAYCFGFTAHNTKAFIFSHDRQL